MEINIYNQFGSIAFDYEKAVADVASYFLEENSISVILVGSEEIHRLNKEFRKRDYPTDVISFESGEEGYLGDIFICIDKVYEQSASYGHSQNREFAFLLVHGLLHLLGFDHETKEEESIMMQKQEEILDAIHYPRSNDGKN